MTKEEYYREAKNEFVRTVLTWFPHETQYELPKDEKRAIAIRVAAEDIILAYDQLRDEREKTLSLAAKEYPDGGEWLKREIEKLLGEQHQDGI